MLLESFSYLSRRPLSIYLTLTDFLMMSISLLKKPQTIPRVWVNRLVERRTIHRFQLQLKPLHTNHLLLAMQFVNEGRLIPVSPCFY